jgi:hypothetical protein
VAGNIPSVSALKRTRSLLLVGELERRVVETFERSTRQAGIEMEFVGAPSEMAAWVESHDPTAIALDMTSLGAEAACFVIRGVGRLTAVPIVGLAPELTDLTFPEIYGWGGDDVIRTGFAADLVPRLRGLTLEKALEAPSRRGEVVVMDGDRRRRILYGRVFHNAGYDVRFALTLAETLTATRHAGVVLVIAHADLQPDGGAAVAKRLRADRIALPIIIPAAPMTLQSHQSSIRELAKVAVTDGFAPPENLLFVANELARTGANDGRASARLLYGTVVAFRQKGRETDALGCTYNISAGGLYVRTLAPLEAGVEAWVELRPPRSDRRVRLEGRVVWRRSFGPIESATVPPGFAFQITDATRGDLACFEAGYRAFAADTVGPQVG